MKIGIIAAMQVEVRKLLENMDIQSVENHYGRDVHIASFNGLELFIGVCGIGKANAASFTQLLIDKYDPDLIINTGIAGSLQAGLGTLSLVIADELYQHDIPSRILASTYPGEGVSVFETDDKLRDVLVKSVPENVNLRVGPVASGDNFINSQKLKEEIVEKTGALACDMESAAIAQIAFGAEKRCLIIRSISDEADDNADETYDNFEEAAANLSVEVLLQFLKNL